MQDVVTLLVTLSKRRSARNRQEAYFAFSLIAIKRTGIALNQVTIAAAYAASGCSTSEATTSHATAPGLG